MYPVTDVLLFFTSYKIYNIFFLNCQRRLALDKKFGDIVGYVLVAAVGFSVTGVCFYTAYHLWVRYNNYLITSLTSKIIFDVFRKKTK
jgi:hypothetical protein